LRRELAAAPASQRPDDKPSGAQAPTDAERIDRRLTDLASSWRTMKQAQLDDLIAAMRARLLDAVSTRPPVRDDKAE